jgi:hypothetical protein
MRSSTSLHAWPDRGRLAALWAGWLTGPILFLVVLETNYVLSYVACEARQTWFLHAATVVAASIVALSGWLAWQAAPAGKDPGPLAPVTGVDHLPRWMAVGGVATSAWFVVAILSFEIPIIILHPCT